ncbi:MAG: type ISP restriction/modification enzyme [Bacteroidales bacterium]|jgi:hypothetical protein
MKSKQLIGITIIIFFVFFLLSLNSNNMNNQANNNLQNETKELLQDNEASKGKSEYFTDPIVNEIGGTIEKRYKPPAVFERIPVEQDSFAYYLRNQKLKAYGEKALYYNGKIWINKVQYFDGIPEDIWCFYIGGYQVLDKWLKSRAKLKLDSESIMQFLQITEIIGETINLMNEIDKIIEL